MAKLLVAGIEPRATLGATYGTLGVDMHQRVDVVVTHCATIGVELKLSVVTAVATVDGVVKAHSCSF